MLLRGKLYKTPTTTTYVVQPAIAKLTLNKLVNLAVRNTNPFKKDTDFYYLFKWARYEIGQLHFYRNQTDTNSITNILTNKTQQMTKQQLVDEAKILYKILKHNYIQPPKKTNYAKPKQTKTIDPFDAFTNN